MDRHDGPRSARLFGDVTHEIDPCAVEVAGELGALLVESVYERSPALALAQEGRDAVAQQPLAARFRGHLVGEIFAHVVVDGCVVIELQDVKALTPDHEARLVGYLKAMGIDVGLLTNFGRPRREHRRFTRTIDHRDAATEGT